ncbi:MAG TPA: WG repeat-containing protein, partial [Chitinophagales bacterium]|nr:WG repeat-containing protein [Chitinophagales bacterium]
WGYINHNFNWAILPAYAEADDFENGFATVAKRERTKKNIYEYQRYKIDSTGKIIEKLLAKPTKKNKRKRR